MPDLQKMLFSMVLSVGIFLVGCSKERTDPASEVVPSNSIPQEQAIVPPVVSNSSSQAALVDESTSFPQKENLMDTEKHPKTTQDASETVDMDLTGFTPNMLYAEVYHMEMSPDEYIGKTIRITGKFARFETLDENGLPIPGKDVLVCLVSDAMACCSVGLEFVPTDEAAFLKSQPEQGSKITVTGRCDIFKDESGFITIIRLNDAQIEQAE